MVLSDRRRDRRRWSPRRSRALTHRAINGEDSERSENGSDQAWSSATGSVPADGTAADPSHDRARDTEQGRDEEPGRITAGHDEACDRAVHEADVQSDDKTPAPSS